MTADPSMKCVCGYRRFRQTVQTVMEEAQCWVRFTGEGAGGFGSTPFGTFFGSGPGGLWGLFALDVARTHRIISCESCARPRSDRVIGGVGVFGSYVFDGNVFVLVDSAALLSCMRIRFTHEDGTPVVDVTPTPYGGALLPVELEDPITTATTPPAGAVLAAGIYAEFPSVEVAGTYDVTLVDICADVSTELLSVELVAGALLLEDESPFLLEDGGPILLE